jgi:hypothetical protein
MTGSRWAIAAVVAVVFVAGAGAVGYQAGRIITARGLTVTRVTPHQAAEAMKGDHFFSDYGRSALILEGTVTAVTRNGSDTVVALASDSSFGTSCDMGALSMSPKVGDRFTVVTSGGSAERLPSGVLLHECLVP